MGRHGVTLHNLESYSSGSDSCDDDNEPYRSIKYGDLLTQLRDYQLLKKGCVV
jgi:hypothetical protein